MNTSHCNFYDRKQCLYGHSFYWLEKPLVIALFLLLFQGYWLTWWTRLIECTCSSWLLHTCRLNINKSAMCTCFLSLNQYSLDISPIGNVILQVFIQIVYKQSVDFFEENIIHNSRCLIVNDNVIANKDMIFSFGYHPKLTFKSFVTKCVFF